MVTPINIETIKRHLTDESRKHAEYFLRNNTKIVDSDEIIRQNDPQKDEYLSKDFVTIAIIIQVKHHKHDVDVDNKETNFSKKQKKNHDRMIKMGDLQRNVFTMFIESSHESDHVLELCKTIIAPGLPVLLIELKPESNWGEKINMHTSEMILPFKFSIFDLI